MSSFYDREELMKIGFSSVGNDVQISRKASIYGATRISIGSHVRLDDFCILSAGVGGISIGNYVHLSAYVSLVGAGNITMEDFSGLSFKVSIFSSNDDYSGEFMTNPTVSDKFTGVRNADVRVKKHAIVGTGSVILPGVTLGVGTVVAALSLMDRDGEPFYIYRGNPAKKIVQRSRELLEKEISFLNSFQE